MNDSVDMAADVENTTPGAKMKAAASRLRTALDSLESRLATHSKGDAQMEARLREAEALAADRAELASRLDQVTAEAKAARDTLEAKERDFAQMARDSQAEIDTIRAQIEAALNTGGDS